MMVFIILKCILIWYYLLKCNLIECCHTNTKTVMMTANQKERKYLKGAKANDASFFIRIVEFTRLRRFQEFMSSWPCSNIVSFSWKTSAAVILIYISKNVYVAIYSANQVSSRCWRRRRQNRVMLTTVLYCLRTSQTKERMFASF